MGCRLSGQQAKLFIHSVAPSNDYSSANLSEQSHEQKGQMEHE